MSSIKTTMPVSTEPSPGYRVNRTQPDELLRHDISDEELDALSDMRRDHLWEGMWGAIGVFLGALPGTSLALINSYASTPQVPISGTDLVQILMCGISLAISVLLGAMVRSRGKGATNLVQKIRSRRPNLEVVDG